MTRTGIRQYFMKRRNVLAGLGTVSLGGLAGCSQLRGDRQLTGIRLLSFDQGSTRIDIQITRDGEQVHATTVELSHPSEGGFAGTSIECRWSTDVAPWDVRARIAGHDEWVNTSTGGFTTETCWLVQYTVRDGNLTVSEEPICAEEGDCWNEWTADPNSGEV